MLPTKVKDKTVAKTDGVFKRALARFRNEPAVRRIPPKARTPSGPARITVHRCVETLGAFIIIWRRQTPDALFTIHEIRAIKPDNADGGTGANTATQHAAFPNSEFNWTGIYCPWCGSANSILQCGNCGENVCGARTEWHDGSTWQRCTDQCGFYGPVFDADVVRAANPANNKPASGNKQTGMLAGDKRKTLAPPARALPSKYRGNKGAKT